MTTQTLPPPASTTASTDSAPRPRPTSVDVTPTWLVLPARQRDDALVLWRELEQRMSIERTDSDASPNQTLPTLLASAADAGSIRHENVPLAVSSDWVETWLQHYGRVVPHEFLVLSDDAGPVGITLLTRGLGRGVGPFREKSRHLGTAGEAHGESVCVEHNQLLVLPEHRELFQERIVAHVLRDKSWEAFRLDGFSEAAADDFQTELAGFEVRYRESPYYDLQATRESGGDLLDPLGRSTRQNTRRLLRKYGEIETEWAESLDGANDIFEELVSLHQARWMSVGQPGAFHSRRFRDFQRSLIERSFETQNRTLPTLPASAADAGSIGNGNACSRQRTDRRRVVLFRARHEGTTVGCLMLLIDCNRLLDYLSGFADFHEKPSPGVVTHVLCMQEALQRGFDAYDFLVGEKRHKDNLSTDSQQLIWAVWRRPNLRNRTIDTLRRLKRRWRQMRSGSDVASPADPAA